MTRTRVPTQKDIRDRGECGYGYRPSDGNHCGRPSELGATFGDCADHAREFREMDRDIARADTGYQSDHRIELGDRVAEADRWENLGLRRTDWAEALVRRDAVKQRCLDALDARADTPKRSGRSRRATARSSR